MCLRIHLGEADAGADAAARVFAFVRSRKFWLLILERRRSASSLVFGFVYEQRERSNYLEICGAA